MSRVARDTGERRSIPEPINPICREWLTLSGVLLYVKALRKSGAPPCGAAGLWPQLPFDVQRS